MHFRTIAVLLLLASMGHAADPVYPEWAVGQIKAFVAGKLIPASDKQLFWHVDSGNKWTAGVAFVRSSSLGEGILVVPDSASGLAYLAYKNNVVYVTVAEAHTLGFGFCPYLTTKGAATAIDLEPDPNIWVLSK